MTSSPYDGYSRTISDIAVISTDAKGLVTVFNQPAEKMLGYIAEEIIGQPAPIVDFEHLCEHCEEQKNTPYERNFIHKNGNTIGMEVIPSPIKGNEGQLTGFLFTATQASSSEEPFTLNDLPNRKMLEIVLDREIRRTQRDEKPLSFLKIDMDFSKAYINHYGDVKEEQCLTKIGKALRGRLKRASDFLAYTDGDEFMVILPSTDRSGAVKIAEQLRLIVVGMGLAHPASTVEKIVTISIGIAHLLPTQDTEIDEVLRLADQGLQQAKDDGRNCTRLG